MKAVPPPWVLTGSGTILTFRPDRQWALPHIPEAMRSHYRGGPIVVMLVDYTSSPVGPYREALFIPGLFQRGGGLRPSITTIYVSTEVSVENGRRNWAIPKQIADFDVSLYTPNVERFRMTVGGALALDCLVEMSPRRLPVNTRWLLLRPALIQPDGDRDLLTAPYGQGRVGGASLRAAQVDGAHFPDFSALSPLATLRAEDFQLTFPEPSVKPHGA